MGNNVGAGDVDIDIGHLVRSIARKWWLVLGVSLAAGAGAYVWATTATPLYRAETRLLIEPRESVFTRPADNVDTSLDSEGVSSQVEVISSSQLLQEVARELDLASLEEFSAKPSALQRLLVRLGLARDPGEIPTEEVVLMSLREKLDVYRVENSRVIVISFSSADPDLAEVRVVMLTARSDFTDKQEGLRAGADDYIVKPVRLAELGQKVERNLEARGREG